MIKKETKMGAKLGVEKIVPKGKTFEEIKEIARQNNEARKG